MINDQELLNGIAIYVIAEDSVAFDTPFLGRSGISLLMELKTATNSTQILYDTNSAAAPVLYNLKNWGKNLDGVEMIFVSHGHCDHVDGLSGILLEMNRPVPVIAHPGIFHPCFKLQPDGVKHIGMVGQNRKSLEEKGAIFTLVSQPFNLMQGVLSTGEIPRRIEFEQPGNFFTVEDGKVVQDPEIDDMALILNYEKGLVIVSGCCHAGIVNTINHAREITGIKKIHAVIGGLHLVGAGQERLDKTIEVLKDVDWILVGHCTGFEAMAEMYSVLKDRFYRIQTGTIIHFPVKEGNCPAFREPMGVRDVHFPDHSARLTGF